MKLVPRALWSGLWPLFLAKTEGLGRPAEPNFLTSFQGWQLQPQIPKENKQQLGTEAMLFFSFFLLI